MSAPTYISTRSISKLQSLNNSKHLKVERCLKFPFFHNTKLTKVLASFYCQIQLFFVPALNSLRKMGNACFLFDRLFEIMKMNYP